MSAFKERAQAFVDADIAREEAEERLIEAMVEEGCDACIIGDQQITKDGTGADDAYLSRQDAPRHLVD